MKLNVELENTRSKYKKNLPFCIIKKKTAQILLLKLIRRIENMYIINKTKKPVIFCYTMDAYF